MIKHETGDTYQYDKEEGAGIILEKDMILYEGEKIASVVHSSYAKQRPR
jgi:hypothetical protein